MVQVFLCSQACHMLCFSDATWANELEKVNNVSHNFNLDYHTQKWIDRCEEINGSQAIEDIQVCFSHIWVRLNDSSLIHAHTRIQ